MKRVFADTSFYAAILNPEDEYHAAASRWGGVSGLYVVVTEFVLLELGNAVSRTPRRAEFPALVEHLRHHSSTLVVPLSRELFDAGLGLYARRRDKDWSVTDCISFVVMAAQSIKDALTADRHFQQAGFKALLR